MRQGEEWALGPRDRGPAKRLARDYVDAHRRPMEFYMYALIVLILALFAGRSSTALGNYMQIFLLVIIAVIAVDAGCCAGRSSSWCMSGCRTSRRAAWRSTPSCARLQLRRFRTPAPRLKPGDQF